MKTKEIVENYLIWKETGGNFFPLSPSDLASIINMVDSGLISSTSAKLLFDEMIKRRLTEAEACYRYVSEIVEKNSSHEVSSQDRI